MSKITLGQRKFPTLGLRSQQPKNYVGPTLSCYLGCFFNILFNQGQNMCSSKFAINLIKIESNC